MLAPTQAGCRRRPRPPCALATDQGLLVQMGANEVVRSLVLDELVNRPLSSVAEELGTLRQDNALLQDTVKQLREELDRILPVSRRRCIF